MEKDERGQILPVAGFMTGVMMLVALLVSHVAAAANTQAHLQTAADAAALAGVRGGKAAAETAASANNAELEKFVSQGQIISTTVRIGDQTARATAELRGGLEVATPQMGK